MQIVGQFFKGSAVDGDASEVSFAPAYGDWAVEGHGKFVRFESGVEAPVHTHTNVDHGIVISGALTNPCANEADVPEVGPNTY